MIQNVKDSIPFSWKKKDLIYAPRIPGFTHGSHPCAIHIKDDLFIIAFTARDENQRSHIFLNYAEVINGEVKLIDDPKLALKYGEPGFFDCDGVISACLVKHDSSYYLYYVGWQNLPNSFWICDTGRTILDVENLKLTREFNGPVLGRDKDNPLFAAATAFLVENDLWRTWYNSGLAWVKTEDQWKHFYGIHYAESSNGIDWKCSPGMCIPFKDKYEYAFGRPSVIKIDNNFYMWFAHRESVNVKTYRMGFAFSTDGYTWQRNDDISGIDISNEGWDSQMICYPSVFKHKNNIYMLYNGNNYGETGFGLAVMEN